MTSGLLIELPEIIPIPEPSSTDPNDFERYLCWHYHESGCHGRCITDSSICGDFGWCPLTTSLVRGAE
jgi:hypothetical protein